MRIPQNRDPSNAHDVRYIKKHRKKVRRLLRRYRRGSRWAAKALIGEMSVIKMALEAEIPNLCNIDPNDRANLDRNAEEALAALENHLDEVGSRRSILHNAAIAVGAMFIALGAVLLCVEAFTLGLHALEEMNPAGAAFAAVGGIIVAASKPI